MSPIAKSSIAALALTRIVGDFYLEHLRRLIDEPETNVCNCTTTGPDERCNVGVALWNLQKSYKRRYNDPRNGP